MTPDYRFIEFVKSQFVGPIPAEVFAGVWASNHTLLGITAMTERLSGSSDQEWKYRNTAMQTLWECWKNGHEAGWEDMRYA